MHSSSRERADAHECSHMPPELLSLPPLALALWLVVFEQGTASDHGRERVAIVLGGSVLLGPLALAVLGFFGWLLLVIIIALTLIAFAVGRHAGLLPRRLRLPKRLIFRS